ncbi:GPW/gp25 family protein [Campylobacter troglodytis]|uniref:GPW/gp25 family protein n=1 Tax=Campylobacter troglodytis TaxID=654363 RepID=UPI001157FA96|nr:GPW/gp25 family protein [Campylobacter troglodytis]TQR53304.1 type VI secretion system baseplate subunit TssE [Campylobacter troglodytis]
MSLLDRIMHGLDDEEKGIAFYQNEFEDIKNNIRTLLNSHLDDCVLLGDLGIGNLADLSFNSSEFCTLMAREICKLINKYEKRIQITALSYDNSLSPWQLSFLLGSVLLRDNFQSLNMQIIFKNNRYCEIV